jgi:signal transduction histidine kinase
VEYDGGNEGWWSLRNFFKDPKNLRYSLNTIIPIIVFLTSILSALVAFRLHKLLLSDLLWILGVSFFSCFCSFLVVSAMTQPVKDLVRKVDKIMRFEESRKERGGMIEVYQLIERLMDLLKSKRDNDMFVEKSIMEDIERLDYIVPLGYMSLTVAHEVRNPLSTITGMSELLKKKMYDEQAVLYVETILEAAKKIDVFTKELLDFIDNEIFDEYFDINTLIEEAIKTLCIKFQLVKCDFKKTDSINFSGDKNKIYQAVFNILKNAFEYEQNGGGVHVEVKLADKLCISIHNEHSRIEKEDIGSIYKPFYSKKKGGRGLGLFTSVKNIRLHKGDIKVESNDEGTTFTIELPIGEGKQT